MWVLARIVGSANKAEEIRAQISKYKSSPHTFVSVERSVSVFISVPLLFVA